MRTKVAKIKISFSEELAKITDVKSLEELKVRYLGKKGLVQDLLKFLKDCDRSEIREMGMLINDLKTEIADLLFQKEASLYEIQKEELFSKEWLDISLPGQIPPIGRFHPVSLMKKKLLDIFANFGFSVQYAPDMDSDFYNFESLNFPKDHPAREMQDTFYITEQLLMRTQTSNAQVRTMETHKPPIKIVSPGRCFRNENVSARSHIFFHQIEGVYIDTDVSFSDLMRLMEDLWNHVFEKEVEVRFRPSYFPFVEPGMEVDIRCFSCAGKGCSICKSTGWLEVLGTGMIHPEVLKFGGIDAKKYSGYAFGLGIERFAMLYYGVKDIRLFTENDLRLLSQFS